MSKQIAKTKNGGPYTKKESEERKMQVYTMHFEEKKSALQIAELLDVNRNTVNDDIKFWYLQFGSKIKPHDLSAKLTNQIQRIGIQRGRLLESLEESETFEEKIKIEKFISEIDNRLVQLFSKMITNGQRTLEPTVDPEEISEDKIKEFVRDLILSDDDPYSHDYYTEEQIKFEFIKRAKCDGKHADKAFNKMKQLGLDLCRQKNIAERNKLAVICRDYSEEYNLGRFVHLRGYITYDEDNSVYKKRARIRQEIETEHKERDEKFITKYGSDKSKWSEEIKDMYDNFEEPE